MTSVLLLTEESSTGQPKRKAHKLFILSVIPPFSSLFGTRVVVSSSCCYLIVTGLCDLT